jgi:alkylation response protein AidB-like acyl-CoA dehydrogenase
MNTPMSHSFQELCQQAGARAHEFEAARQVTGDFARQLAAADMFRLFAPREMGGAEFDLPAGLARLEDLAKYDAACAWISMIGATTSQLGASLSPRVGKIIFGGEAPICCGVFAPTGKAWPDDDGYRVAGRWAWASGSANADWILLGVFLGADRDSAPDPKQMRFAALPRMALIFHDTWHSLGLRATSSGDVEVDGYKIPSDQLIDLASAQPQSDSPLYRLPYFGFLALGVAACALGNAAGCVREFETLAANKTPRASSRPLGQQGRIQAQYAETLASLRAARALFAASAEAVWASACAANELAPSLRADTRLAATHAVQQSCAAIRSLHDMAGGSAVYQSNPIQKRLRDAETMTQHMITASASFEMIGRVLFGDYQPHMQL